MYVRVQRILSLAREPVSALPCWLLTVSEPTRFRYIHGLGWLFCFLAPDLETAISPRSLGSLEWRRIFRNQVLAGIGDGTAFRVRLWKNQAGVLLPLVCQQHRALPLPPPDLWPPFPTSEFGPQHQCLVLTCSAL